jgi:hypothetical protein
MNKSTQSRRLTEDKNNGGIKSTLDEGAISHLKDLALDNRVLNELDGEENMTIEELQDLEQSVSARDPNFQSELEYEGYKSIQAYDNDEFRSNMDNEEDNLEELNFEDRVEDESITEENIVDKQDNRRDTGIGA